MGKEKKKKPFKSGMVPWYKMGLSPSSSVRSIKSGKVIFGGEEKKQIKTTIIGLEDYLSRKYPGTFSKSEIKEELSHESSKLKSQIKSTKITPKSKALSKPKIVDVEENFIKKHNISKKLYNILKKDLMARRLWSHQKITEKRFKGTEEELLETIKKNNRFLELFNEFENFGRIKNRIEKAIVENPELRKSIASRNLWVDQFCERNGLNPSEKKKVADYLLIRVTQINRQKIR